MKKLLSAISLSAAIFSGTAGAASNFGFIDLNALFNNLPEATVKIQEDVKSTFSKDIESLSKLRGDLLFHQSELEKKKALMSESEINAKISLINSLRDKLNADSYSLSTSVKKFEAGKKQELLADINNVLKDIMKKKNFDAILTRDSTISISPSDDITKDVFDIMKENYKN